LDLVPEQLAGLVQEGLTVEVVLRTFFAQRIRPLRARFHMMWLYAGLIDPTRELADELTEAEVDARVKSVLDVGVMGDLRPHLAPLCQGVPLTRVSAPRRPS
jgi:hypothetical protein